MKKQIKIGLASFGALVATTVPLVFATSCPENKHIYNVVWSEEVIPTEEANYITGYKKTSTTKEGDNLYLNINVVEGRTIDLDTSKIFCDYGGTGKKTSLTEHAEVRDSVTTKTLKIIYIPAAYIKATVTVVELHTKVAA